MAPYDFLCMASQTNIFGRPQWLAHMANINKGAIIDAQTQWQSQDFLVEKEKGKEKEIVES